MTRGPTIVRVAPSDGNGVKCCCCRCCECFNLGYLISQHGLIKLAEAMLGGLCQTLLVKYGMYEAGLMGSAFFGFLTTASSCLLVTALLITCYTVSSKSQQLIRQSIFIFSIGFFNFRMSIQCRGVFSVPIGIFVCVGGCALE
ncbi:protein singles bar isoform X2 [Hyposmocoma kahamanoa]|uniref:protein singles bar isoform X2 n=1 Tax=Hyposmocoma kahamanoa TaxID=1477025 RepID=UPI000E6D7E82|nr:protein singles bar isoform X2 [Hyposmocoma kahamanoa]XP_026329369.1 protein singles bar isoform X2 [Hyposmocoma kahamanoa]